MNPPEIVAELTGARWRSREQALRAHAVVGAGRCLHRSRGRDPYLRRAASARHRGPAAPVPASTCALATRSTRRWVTRATAPGPTVPPRRAARTTGHRRKRFGVPNHDCSICACFQRSISSTEQATSYQSTAEYPPGLEHLGGGIEPRARRSRRSVRCTTASRNDLQRPKAGWLTDGSQQAAWPD